jgi:hypothetical protein
VLSPSREAAKDQSARRESRSEALVELYGDKSIAVLPFADMSPGHDQEYFSDWIAEELLNLLAKIPELRVISRSSARHRRRGSSILRPTRSQSTLLKLRHGPNSREPTAFRFCEACFQQREVSRSSATPSPGRWRATRMIAAAQGRT